MSSKGLSPSRAKIIYRRQKEAYWDERYTPGILATVKEAPSIPHAFTLTSQKLGGREVHLLSTPERNAAFLGLYNPAVVGLQEQRMLSTTGCEHPLWSHPDADRASLTPLKGIIDIAEQLGMLDELPVFAIPAPDQPTNRISIIYPWCGDLLWAVKERDGKIKCINWNIKDKLQNFNRPLTTKHFIGPGGLLARYQIEEAHYASANIRTVSIANEQIDHHVVANLRQLFLHHRQHLPISNNARQEIVARLQAAQCAGITPAEVITYYSDRKLYSVDETRTIFYQAIWNRELRVDLFYPILINLKMRPERVDVLEHYADWFRCMPCM